MCCHDKKMHRINLIIAWSGYIAVIAAVILVTLVSVKVGSRTI